MKPRLTNLRILKEALSGTGAKVMLDHSGLSEIRARGSAVNASAAERFTSDPVSESERAAGGRQEQTTRL
jgi:hypothetical protein